MRLEVEGAPNATDGHVTESRRFGHVASAPVRGVRGDEIHQVLTPPIYVATRPPRDTAQREESNRRKMLEGDLRVYESHQVLV